MREALGDEDVAVEAGEARDRRDADRTKGMRVDVQKLAVRDVRDEMALAVRLQTEHRRVARLDLALHRAARDDRLAAALEAAVHDELVLHAAVLEALRAGVAAVEAHVEVALLRTAELDALRQDVVRHRVVDVQKRRRLLRRALEHVLGHRTVHVDLACDRNAAARETRVDVARNEMERRLEGRPALVREDRVLGRTALVLVPVHERKLELRELREEIRIRTVLAELLLHVLHDRIDLGRARRHLVEVLEEVELGVLLDVDAEVEERLDRRVAGEEVLGTRTEAEHLEVLDAVDHARDLDEVLDLRDRPLRIDVRVLGDVDLETAQAAVVAEVQHAAERIAAVAREHRLVLLAERNHHRRHLHLLDEERRGTFRTEVAEEHAAGVDAFLARPRERLDRVVLVLDRNRAVDDARHLRLLELGHDGRQTLLRQRRREAVAADANDTQLDNRLIVHLVIP